MDNALKPYLAKKLKRFNEEMYAELTKTSYERDVKRNELLLKPGELSNHLYFVNNGCLRTYRIRKREGESTSFFCFEGNINIDIGFFTSTSHNEYIQAVERTQVIVLHRENFERLYDVIPSLFTDMAYLFYNIIVHKSDFFNLKNTERYKWLLQNNPKIIQRLSSKLVASYLGMHQVSLSRIRAAI